jgi:hypothetical protein
MRDSRWWYRSPRYAAIDDPAGAAEAYQAAVSILDELGHTDAAAVRARLDALRVPTAPG